MSFSEIFLIIWGIAATVACAYYHHEYWIARRIAVATLDKIKQMVQNESVYRSLQRAYIESGLSNKE